MFTHVELIDPCLRISSMIYDDYYRIHNEYCGKVKSPEFGGINELMTDGWILWIEMIIYDMINWVSSWAQ